VLVAQQTWQLYRKVNFSMTLRYKDFSTPSLAIPLKSPLISIINVGIPKDKVAHTNLNSFVFPVPVAPIKPWRFKVFNGIFTSICYSFL
jgi:hypothetical protein